MNFLGSMQYRNLYLASSLQRLLLAVFKGSLLSTGGAGKGCNFRVFALAESKLVAFLLPSLTWAILCCSMPNPWKFGLFIVNYWPIICALSSNLKLKINKSRLVGFELFLHRKFSSHLINSLLGLVIFSYVISQPILPWIGFVTKTAVVHFFLMFKCNVSV